jgi:hypothetical protein
MRSINILITCSIFILFAGACTVQKRLYRNGYFLHGSIHHNPNAKIITEKMLAGEMASICFDRNQKIRESQSNSTLPSQWANINASAITDTIQFDRELCDSLFLKDGTILEVKIKEIGTKDIRYKLCDFQEGPDYLVEKFRVSAIRFINGKREEFNERPPAYPKNKSPNSAIKPENLEKNNNASQALTWGILGIYPLWIFGSIVGLVFGLIAVNQFKANPGRYSNELSGKVGLGLSAGALAIWAVLIFLVLIGI